jgi:hypothetical protein
VDNFFKDLTARYGRDVTVPDELLTPDWEDWMRRNLQSEAVQTNVLLDMLAEGLPLPHFPAIGKLTPQESWDELVRRLSSDFPSSLSSVMKFSLKRGEYPDYGMLSQLEKLYGVPLVDILRSRPR